MKIQSLTVLVMASLSACATAGPDIQVPPPGGELRIAPAAGGDLGQLKVSLSLPGDADGETVFIFPETWGPEEDLGGLRRDLSAVDAASGAPLAVEGSDARVVVSHAPSQEIRLSWTLEQDYDGLPQWGVQRVPGMRPVLQPGHASLIGHTVWPSVDGRDPMLVVTFDGIPGTAAFSQPAAAGVSAPIPLSLARNSLYVLGDYALDETPPLNVRAATRGDWPMTDLEFREAAAAVIVRASDAFGTPPPDQYFVAVTPLPDVPGGSSVIGTALAESFLVLATRNASADTLQHTLVHEILHEWITGRMGPTDEATDPRRMWFTEGFTEYYSQLILLDAGFVSLEAYLANMNDLWAQYQASPVQTMTSDELNDHIWDDRHTERLPYQRGALLALHWDSLAQAKGGRLADAIANLIDRNEAPDAGTPAGQPAGLTDATIEAALAEVVGPGFMDDLTTYIRQGKVIDPDRLSLPACLAVQRTADGVAELVMKPGTAEEACRQALTGSLHPAD